MRKDAAQSRLISLLQSNYGDSPLSVGMLMDTHGKDFKQSDLPKYTYTNGDLITHIQIRNSFLML